MKKPLRIILISVAAIVAVILIGMQLESNKAEIEAEAKVEVITKVPVKLQEVGMEKLSDVLSLVGTVEPNKVVQVSSETNGRVTGIYIDEGSVVSVGTPLASLDDELKKVALTSAKANLEKAQKDVERFENLAKSNAGTGMQVDNARLALALAQSQYDQAQRALRDCQIVSPTYGIVTQKMIEYGELANPGTPVARITDVSVLKVKVLVGEHDVFKLHQGEVVEVTTDVYADLKLTGTVTYISVQGDKAHNYPVEVTIANNGQKPLKAGMFARVNFNQQKKDESLTIPREALVGSIKDPYVFVIENGRAVKRPLQLGMQTDEKLEVMSGLRKGEQVVVAGQYSLKEGAEVTITQ